MPDRFPIAPRARTAVRTGAVAIIVAGAVLTIHGAVTSSTWVGRIFPGFMLLDNRVVASVDLANWSGGSVPGLFQSEVLAVNVRHLGTTQDIYALVASLPPGTPLRYSLSRAVPPREVRVSSLRC